ncbi:MAG: sulfite exporter TauE/SafE family protein [Deltaproteobacteria bacterium]|nr:sulfite exporter TauE/SafE family protein [Deltaproteobacteria bacterium]
MLFPISGVEAPLWLPPLVSFVVSFFTSMAGVSGAFLLLPFQMSYLGFVTPAVSPTNLVYNVVAIPSGVYRFLKEGRMVWPLTWVVVAGTLPGVVAGGFMRLKWFLDPKPFKLFVGAVLLYIAGRMALDVYKLLRGQAAKPKAPAPGEFRVKILSFTPLRLAYRFQGQDYACGTLGIFSLSLVVGLIGGIYGIGGGAIIAPFFVAIYGLPVHTVAGAALMGTFITSIAGVAFFQFIAPWYGNLSVAPDWLLGLMFGLGGVAGIYLGARCQRFVPAVWLKAMLVALMLYVGGRYVVLYFF